MTKKERENYNKWLWNLDASAFNVMNQEELAKIAQQYQRQFRARVKSLDRLQADTGMASAQLSATRTAFERLHFLTGNQFLPNSHIVRKGQIRYSVPQLRSIVANYANFFREDSEHIRTNTVEGVIEFYKKQQELIDDANAKVSERLGVPVAALSESDRQMMWRAYNLFKEIYTEAFALLQSNLTQEAMVYAIQTAPNGESVMGLVERMFEYGMGRVARNGDLNSKFRDEAKDDDYVWDETTLKRRLEAQGSHRISWNNNV